jgi:NhaA family Na+:H+ antiporter
LSLQEFQQFGAGIVEKFRAALATGDDRTAKNMLGSFAQLVQNTESPSELLTRKLNDWVSFLVLPLFALANAGVTFSSDVWHGLLTSRIAWGILLGLVVGKPLGIIGFARIAVSAGMAQVPKGVSWRQLTAVGVLAGIGFTVSIFISSLAFNDESDATHLLEAKTAVLAASLVAGVVGYFALREGQRLNPDSNSATNSNVSEG